MGLPFRLGGGGAFVSLSAGGGRTPRLGAVMGSFRGWGVWDGGGLCRYEDCAGAVVVQPVVPALLKVVGVARDSHDTGGASRAVCARGPFRDRYTRRRCVSGHAVRKAGGWFL